MRPKTIAILVVAALFITILLLNMDEVKIKLIFVTIPMPKLVLILVSLSLGWLFGWFTHMAYYKGKYNSGASHVKTEPKPVDRSAENTEVSKEN